MRKKKKKREVAACKLRFCRSLQERARQPLAAIIAEMFGCLGLGGLPYKSQENGSRQGGMKKLTTGLKTKQGLRV
mgnify:CR=1 FL=1